MEPEPRRELKVRCPVASLKLWGIVEKPGIGFQVEANGHEIVFWDLVDLQPVQRIILSFSVSAVYFAEEEAQKCWVLSNEKNKLTSFWLNLVDLNKNDLVPQWQSHEIELDDHLEKGYR